jgi:hypothetical protein
MTVRHELSREGRSLTVTVLFAVKRRGGRKLAIVPEDAEAWAPPVPRIDNTLVKALARAFRWQRMLESDRFASVTELAEAEKINQSYLCRFLRLTLLAPDIVEAILDGRQPTGLQMDALLKPLPLDWAEQRAVLGL